ncbi:MAG: hypothetical protein ACKVT1_18735 [Dehalococcoidia bacterium]
MKRAWLRFVAPALVAAVAVAGCGGGPSKLEPGIWMAMTEPGPFGDVFVPAPLRVLNAVSGKERSFGPPAGLAWDVLVVPGWKGEAPAMLDAATPHPTPAPRPTPADPPFVPGSAPTPAAGPPYPAPKGARVPSHVADVPLYPAAREVDGFAVAGPERTGNVQMYMTHDPGAMVLDFYKGHLAGLGYRLSGRNEGPDGQDWSYRRGRDAVTISTRYIPRPEDELPQGAPPYGFIEKGRFEHTINGEYFFFVVTLRAPEPP